MNQNVTNFLNSIKPWFSNIGKGLIAIVIIALLFLNLSGFFHFLPKGKDNVSQVTNTNVPDDNEGLIDMLSYVQQWLNKYHPYVLETCYPEHIPVTKCNNKTKGLVR